jgi:hypothetical protein
VCSTTTLGSEPRTDWKSRTEKIWGQCRRSYCPTLRPCATLVFYSQQTLSCADSRQCPERSMSDMSSFFDLSQSASHNKRLTSWYRWRLVHLQLGEDTEPLRCQMSCTSRPGHYGQRLCMELVQTLNLQIHPEV